jgi:cell division septation protein DedD
MAVIEDNKKEKKFEQVLNLADLAKADLPKGEASKLDVDADAYDVPMPPVKDRYDLRVALSEKDAIKMRRIDDKDPSTTYYSVALECRIVSDDPEVANRAAYAYVSSRMAKGQKISTLAYVLFKCGYPKDKLADKEVDQLTLVRGFVKFIGDGRIVKGCLLDWEGYSKEQSKTIFRSMDHFPVGEDGTHEHIVMISSPNGGKEEITARLVIKDWGEKKDGKETPNKGPVVRESKPVVAETPDPVEETPAMPPPVASKPKKDKPMPPPPADSGDDDDEDMAGLFD